MNHAGHSFGFLGASKQDTKCSFVREGYPADRLRAVARSGSRAARAYSREAPWLSTEVAGCQQSGDGCRRLSKRGKSPWAAQFTPDKPIERGLPAGVPQQRAFEGANRSFHFHLALHKAFASRRTGASRGNKSGPRERIH
jgi:hypothetical protein